MKEETCQRAVFVLLLHYTPFSEFVKSKITMQAKAHLRHLRMSPRKVRLVTDLIRGAESKKAREQLKFIPKKASEPVLKLLNSAIANAKNNFNLEENNLFISEIFVNEGRTLKRWRARAMGRSAPIMKRTSHITIVLDEIKPKQVSKKKKKKEAKPKIIKKTEKIKVEKKIIPPKKEEKPEDEKWEKERERFSKQQAARKFSRAGEKMFRRKSI